MLVLAFAFGIFSYLLFCLGILGFLYIVPIVLLALIYWGGFLIWQRKNLKNSWKLFLHFISKKPSKFLLVVGSILVAQIFVNFVGVLGPEIAFDATWYHLTLPKLFLNWHQIKHISGGVLYYADMPKLIEMLYIPGLAIFGDTGPKIIHFLFGILSCVALYKFAKKFLNPLLSVIAVAIFYSNLVVGWESISAYIDLARAFFAILSFLAFFDWVEDRSIKSLMLSAVMLGLGITTKFLAVADFGIFIPLIVLVTWQDKIALLRSLLIFAFVALVIPLPWWIFSYMQTGQVFYPFFTSIYPFDHNFSLNPLRLISVLWIEFTHSADPVSPLYIAFLPFLFLVKKWSKQTIMLGLMGVFSILVWYISPQTGGGRFLLPYLPVLSILVVFVYKSCNSILQKIFLFTFFICLFSSLFYRGIANAKFIPVVFGQETKAEFLQNYLNFSFGDWYDIDGYMKQHIKSTDTVLLYGYHNLYYIDFPYIHYTWVKKGDVFNYIATDETQLPARFKNWKLIYYNQTTHMHVYSDRRKIWTY